MVPASTCQHVSIGPCWDLVLVIGLAESKGNTVFREKGERTIACGKRLLLTTSTADMLIRPESPSESQCIHPDDPTPHSGS